MGETFKPSAYNFFIREGDAGDILLFNGLRSSLIRLPRQLHPITQDLLSLEHVDLSVIPPEARPLLNMLAEGGFIVDNAFDELDIIRERFRRTREEGPLDLVIAPTLDCNLACVYCYQSRSPDTMSLDICDRIIGFTRQKLGESSITNMSVDWYGGEPLLAPEVISYLSEHFLGLSGEFGCGYEASIVTNGTLLDDKAANMLMSSGVKSCQVTIDGPKEIHDKRRGYRQANGSSFDRILSNIKRVIGKMELSVRINVDTDNIQYAYSLLDIFKEEGFFAVHGDFGFFPYVAMVGPINLRVPFNCRPVNISRFYKYSLAFRKKAFEYSGKRWLEPILDFPFPVNAACAALRRNTYAFDPRGYYFKCALEIGEGGKECGHVGDETRWEQCKKWDEYDPLQDSECLGCCCLPFCMGGCPKVEFDKNSFYGKDGCAYWRANLEDIVRLYVRSMEEVTGTACRSIDRQCARSFL